jgi:hypothetical protein
MHVEGARKLREEDSRVEKEKKVWKCENEFQVFDIFKPSILDIQSKRLRLVGSSNKTVKTTHESPPDTITAQSLQPSGAFTTVDSLLFPTKMSSRNYSLLVIKKFQSDLPFYDQ